MQLKLLDKVAVVTGGGRGIGHAIAVKMAKEGSNVIIWELNEKSGSETADEVRKFGRRGLALKVDVTNGLSVKEAYRRSLDEFGRIDILVNNVGWDEIRFFIDTDETFWDKIIAINYKGLLHCCRTVLEQMIEKKYGKIVNISSDAGRVGSLGEAVYSGVKGAIIAFSKTLAREVGRYNINVNVVCPGTTETPLITEMKSKGATAMKILEGVAKASLFGRMAKPEEIAAVVAFLASDEAAFITGQTLSVSGGLTMV